MAVEVKATLIRIEGIHIAYVVFNPSERGRTIGRTPPRGRVVLRRKTPTLATRPADHLFVTIPACGEELLQAIGLPQSPVIVWGYLSTADPQLSTAEKAIRGNWAYYNHIKASTRLPHLRTRVP